MIVKLVIDFEIDHIELSVFNFYFESSDNNIVKFMVPNPEVGTLEEYDKLRNGNDAVINYYDKDREMLSVVLENKIVKFVINSKFGNSIIIVSWDLCKEVFEQAYQWKSYF